MVVDAAASMDASMSGPQQLDRQAIERAFRLMGQYLLDRKALGEIAIYGGSAILRPSSVCASSRRPFEQE
jgi:hypothetical protein